MRKPSKKKVLERIRSLLEMAGKEPGRTDAYVKLAHRLRLKHKIRLPRELKRKYCKYCLTYWAAGKVRVRTRPKSVVYTCLECGRYTRLGR